jgi:hypothetical protein
LNTLQRVLTLPSILRPQGQVSATKAQSSSETSDGYCSRAVMPPSLTITMPMAHNGFLNCNGFTVCWPTVFVEHLTVEIAARNCVIMFARDLRARRWSYEHAAATVVESEATEDVGD